MSCLVRPHDDGRRRPLRRRFSQRLFSFSSPSTLRLLFGSKVNGRLLAHSLRDNPLSLDDVRRAALNSARRQRRDRAAAFVGGGRLFDACRTRSEPKAARHHSKQRLALALTRAPTTPAPFDGFATQVPLRRRRKLARIFYREGARIAGSNLGPRSCWPIAAGVVSFGASVASPLAQPLHTHLLKQ